MFCNLIRNSLHRLTALAMPLLFAVSLSMSASSAAEEMVELLVSSTEWPAGSAVMRYDAWTGKFRGQLDDPDENPLESQYILPKGLAVGSGGQVYVAYRCSTCDNPEMSAILKFSPITGGRFLTPFASDRGKEEGFEGLAISPDGFVLYAGQRESGRIHLYEIQSGKLLHKFPNFLLPRGLTFDRSGILYVLSQSDKFVGAGQIVGITNLGVTFPFVEPELRGPLQLDESSAGLVFGPDGDLYVVSSGQDTVLRYTIRRGSQPPSAVFRGEFATPGDNGCVDPVGLAFGPHDQNLYVTCRTSNNVVRYDGRSGRFLSEFISSGDSTRLRSPTYVAFVRYNLSSSIRLISPPNGEQTEPVTVFRWTRSQNPAVQSYRLLIATDPYMENEILSLPEPGGELIVAPQVAVRLRDLKDNDGKDVADQILYWQVIAQGNAIIQSGSEGPDEQSQEIFSCFFNRDNREYTQIRGLVTSDQHQLGLVGARVAVNSERHADTTNSFAETQFNGEYIVIAVTRDSHGYEIQFPIEITSTKFGYHPDEKTLGKERIEAGVITCNLKIERIFDIAGILPWIQLLLLKD